MELDDIKTEYSVLTRDKSSRYLKLLAGRCPAHRWHELNIGFKSGTFELVARMQREKPQGGQTSRVKVPRPSTRAERLVVVEKSL